jgi:ABC-type lipoprotein export system ATPase subunit
MGEIAYSLKIGGSPVNVSLEKIVVRLPSSGKRLFSFESLHISSGERVLVQGPSGRGKTTLIHLMAGLFPPDEGIVKLGTTNLSGLTESDRSRFRRESLGIVFQKLNLLPHLTALENVLLGMKRSEDSREIASQSLTRLGLEDHVDVLASELSLGEQQRVAVARVAAAAPKLILADEPTSSLDDENAEAVCDALFDSAREATVVVVSHDHRINSRFNRVIQFDQIVARGEKR